MLTAVLHRPSWLERCPGCGYALAALPRNHRCPECGFVYDESMMVLEGWRVPGLRSWGRYALRYGWIVLLVMVVLRLTWGWSWSVLAIIPAGVVVVAAGLGFYVWWRDDSPSQALARFLITADGVARLGALRGTVRRRIYLWRNYSHLMLFPGGEGGWRLHLYPDWWRLFGPPIVNARLDCSDAEAEAVRAEIQRRINAARTAEAEARVGEQEFRGWWGW